MHANSLVHRITGLSTGTNEDLIYNYSVQVRALLQAYLAEKLWEVVPATIQRPPVSTTELFNIVQMLQVIVSNRTVAGTELMPIALKLYGEDARNDQRLRV